MPVPMLCAPGIPPIAVSLEPEPEAEEGVVDSVDIACSDIAVVGMALVIAPEETPPKGIRPEENLDDVECRDPLEEGRSGEGWEGPWL